MKVIEEFTSENGNVRLIEELTKFKIQICASASTKWSTIGTWYSQKVKTSHVKYFNKTCKLLMEGVKINER